MSRKGDPLKRWQNTQALETRRETLAAAVDQDDDDTALSKRINCDLTRKEHKDFKRWADDRGGMRAVLRLFVQDCLRGNHDETYRREDG